MKGIFERINEREGKLIRKLVLRVKGMEIDKMKSEIVGF